VRFVSTQRNLYTRISHFFTFVVLICRIMCCSPAHARPQRSSSLGNSLDPNVMDSGSLPAASSPKATDDAEVLSRRTFPGQGEVQEAVRVAPEGDTSAAGHMGEQIPLETGYGAIPNLAPSRILFRRPIRLRN